MLRRLSALAVVFGLFTTSASAGQFAAAPTAGADPITEAAAPPPVAPQPEDTVAPHAVVSRAAVRAALAARRARSIAAFRAYWRGGVYPHNTYTDAELNVWRDEDGHLCAAATIIAKSGLRTQVLQQASDDNFIRLVDVDAGWLMDWMLTSGLTQEELVAIQKPFRPVVGELDADDVIRMPKPNPVIVRSVDRQLRRDYVKVDRMLARQGKRSLERAVDRLMAHPELAAQLVADHVAS